MSDTSQIDLFKILGHQERYAILRRLMAGQATLSQLGEHFGETPAHIRHHLKILEQAGLVEFAEALSGAGRAREVLSRNAARPVRPPRGASRDSSGENRHHHRLDGFGSQAPGKILFKKTAAVPCFTHPAFQPGRVGRAAPGTMPDEHLPPDRASIQSIQSIFRPAPLPRSIHGIG